MWFIRSAGGLNERMPYTAMNNQRQITAQCGNRGKKLFNDCHIMVHGGQLSWRLLHIILYESLVLMLKTGTAAIWETICTAVNLRCTAPVSHMNPKVLRMAPAFSFATSS